MLNPPSISNFWNNLVESVIGAVGWPQVAPVVLPADEGEHVFPMEWWYFTGHLTATRGTETRPLAFEMTVFRLAEPLAGVAILYGGYFSRIDLDAQSYRGVQRFVPPWNFSKAPNGFDVFFDDPNTAAPTPWRVSAGANGTDARFEITAGVDTESLSIVLETDRPATLHGDLGRVDLGLGAGVRAAYYSRTQLAASGSWTDRQGDAWTLSGTAWEDHQWGILLAIGRRWHFFAIQFEGGERLACYEVFEHSTDTRLAINATWVDRNGTSSAATVTITEATRTVDPLEIYPLSFDLVVTLGFDFNGGTDVFLQVDAAFRDQVRNPTTIPGLASFEFWEGVSRVVTVGGTDSIKGQAFVELGGYAPGSL